MAAHPLPVGGPLASSPILHDHPDKNRLNCRDNISCIQISHDIPYDDVRSWTRGRLGELKEEEDRMSGRGGGLDVWRRGGLDVWARGIGCLEEGEDWNRNNLADWFIHS